MIRPLSSIGWVLPAVLACVFAPVRAEPPVTAEDLPKEFEGAGITEHLNEQVPLDIQFKDENGNDVTLRDLLKPDKPIILTPVYYTCPGICNHVLNGLVNGLNDIEWSAGKEFQIVSFTINPAEQPSLAKLKKEAYLTQYKRASAKDGWHFLTGEKQNIDAMCQAIGFGYTPDDKGQFAHSATIVFLTPEGKIARYMNDVLYQPRDLRFALVESSQGSIGSAMDKFMLFMCYNYDPHSNSYAASAMKIMRFGALMTLLLMAAGFVVLSRRGRGGRGRESSEGGPQGRPQEALG